MNADGPLSPTQTPRPRSAKLPGALALGLAVVSAAAWIAASQAPLRAQDKRPETVFTPPPVAPPRPAPEMRPAGQADDTTASAATKLRLAVLLPLSGKHKRLGEVVRDAITLAKVDRDGPELVFEDSRGTPEGARAAIDRLAARDDIAAVLGPVGWGESRAAAERADDVKLPLISLSSQQGLEDLGAHVFRGRPSVEEQARVIAKFALSDVQVPRYAILHPDDPIGRAAAEVFFETVRAGGARVTAWASYKSGDTNLDHAVAELVGQRGPRLGSRSTSKPPRSRTRPLSPTSHVNFDAVFIPDYGDTVALAVKFLRFYDVTLAGIGDGSSVQLLGTSHMPGRHLADAEGLATGALFPDVFGPDSDREGVQGFMRRYREAFDREATDLDAHAYDLYILAADTIAGLQLPAESSIGDARERTLNTLRRANQPHHGLTGPRWWHPNGAPGYAFQVWVVDSSGAVSIAVP